MHNFTEIRLGVIGLGAVAQSVHLPLIRRRPDLFELTAVSEVSPSVLNRVGSMFSVPERSRYSDASEMLEHDGLDAILICSGGSHAALVVAALNRGLYVLCEKPLAFTLGELEMMSNAHPLGSSHRLMVGYMKQYDPAVTRTAELLSQIDDIRTIDVSVLHPPGQSQLDFAHLVSPSEDIPQAVIKEQRQTDVALRAAALGDGSTAVDLWPVYAGCLLSSLSHDMSVLRRLTGPVTKIDHTDIWTTNSPQQVRATGRDTVLGEPPPSIRAVGATRDGIRVLLDWHYLHDYPAYRETVRIVYGSGSLELAFPSPYLLHAPTVLTQFSLDGEAENRTEFRSTGEAFEIQLEAFWNMVHHGTRPFTDIDGARHDIVTSQAIITRYAHRLGLRLAGEIGLIKQK